MKKAGHLRASRFFGAQDFQFPKYSVHEFRAKRTKYCICIPVINEGERIRRQLRAMKKYSHFADIVIADGNSSDGSLDGKFLRANCVRTLLVKLGPGKLSAQMRMALHYCLREGYEGFIFMDGNGKDDPAALPRFVKALEKGYDHVQGSRFVRGGKTVNNPLFRVLLIKLVHAPLVSIASGFHYTDSSNGFRAYSRKLISDPSVAPFRDVFSGYELHYYLATRAPRLGYKVVEVPVIRRYPKNGKVPTKIHPVFGYLLILRALLYSCLGFYNPKSSVVGKSKAR